MSNRFLPAPSIENLDGVACAALADFVVAEPFTHIGTETAVEDYAVFYSVAVLGDGSIVLPPGQSVPPNYMVVEIEERGMLVCDPCNRMEVCRGPS